MNHFDNLPSEIQDKIFKHAHNSLLSECMKELPTSKVFKKARWLGWKAKYIFRADDRDWFWKWYGGDPCWFINLRAIVPDVDGFYQSYYNYKDRRTLLTNCELKAYLKHNGFKGLSKMKKDELIRLCLSF